MDNLIDPDQRSSAWHDQRAGKPTSSQIYRLLSDGTRDMTKEELAARPKKGKGSKTTKIFDASVLGKAAMTYIDELVASYVTGQSNDGGSYATAWGEDHEEEGKAYFSEKTGLHLVEVNFVPFLTISGGSPDADIPDDDAILELKCPYNSANQIAYIETLHPDTVRDLFFDHFCQVQANMLWLKRSKAYLATYDPRMPEELKMKVIVIPADPEFQNLILLKVEQAHKIILERVTKLKSLDLWKETQKINETL